MAKPTPVTITILPSSNLVFGGHVDYAVSVPITTAQTVEVTVANASGVTVLDGFAGNGSTVNPDGLGGSFPLGPTPMWSSGGGTGALTAMTWNAAKSVYQPTKGSTPASFTVSA